MALLKVENLTFTYPLCASPAVCDASFTIEKGEFVTVCGATGSGKSTLLRLIKRELAPLGEVQGTILMDGVALDALPADVSAYTIGYVMQRPEQQIVTDKVWHELAFGLENMHVPQPVIARRVAEMAAYFGIEDWFDKPVSALSGGQKQLLNLASVMVMQPSLLILDEPTAQLDPIAAADFIATLHKLNREMDLTILIIEHRLEEVIPISDKVLVLEAGRVLAFDAPRQVVAGLSGREDLLRAMPAAARLYHAVGGRGDCPLDVREGRRFVTGQYGRDTRALPVSAPDVQGAPALQFQDVYFRYERNAPDVLQALNLTVYENEILCIVGGNGSGKTTTLSAAAGIIKPYSGTVKVFEKKLKDYKNQSLYRNCLTLLPQDVQTLFLRNTVREELAGAEQVLPLLPIDLTRFADKHPYDLSGGEQQMLALCKVLAACPRILLLDEPTKGVDAFAKNNLVQLLKTLKEQGMTIVIVTHDVEFAALCADRCAMFFRGNIVSEGTPSAFFGENNFYTTAVSRMTRGYYEGAVTVEDAAALCRLNGRKGGAV